MRHSPRGEQSTDKCTVTLSPRFFAESQDQSTIPSHVSIDERFSDFWPSAHRLSRSITTTEPLAHEKSFVPSHHDTTSLSGQNESMSDMASPSTTRTELTSPVGHSNLHFSASKTKDTNPRPIKEVQGSRPSISTRIQSPLEDQTATRHTKYVSPPSSAAIVQAALPLFQGIVTPPQNQSHLPNPLASTLVRDALLNYANQLYKCPFEPTPGLAVPPVPYGLTSPQHPYRTQLLPLLRNLKLLHPEYIPILLLLGCVYQAIGDYVASIHENEEILKIDENFVRLAFQPSFAYLSNTDENSTI